MPKIQIGRPTEDPDVTEWIDIGGVKDIAVTITIDTTQFDKSMNAVAELMNEGRCPELCRVCGTERCIGDDPHAERFGPFHVFRQHDHFALNLD